MNLAEDRAHRSSFSTAEGNSWKQNTPSGMNVLVPMRIVQNTSPVLTRVAGKRVITLVIDSLQLGRQDTLWLIVNSSAEKDIKRIARSYQGMCTVRIVPVPFLTRGPVETITAGLSKFSSDDLKRKILCLDSDSLHLDNILLLFRQAKENLLFYFKTDSPKYSHIILEETKSTLAKPRIMMIKEKTLISSFGLTGAYGFKTAEVLKKYCMFAIEDNKLWLSELCQIMLDHHHIFMGNPISNFYDLGIKHDRHKFVGNLLRGTAIITKPMKIAVSLENLLVRTGVESITDCEPNRAEIEKVQKLKAMGHTIVITTGRNQSTDMLKTLAIGNITLNQIKRFNIPFDEIYFGQPSFDMLLSEGDTMAELGIEFDGKQPMDAVKPRSFNTVDFISDHAVQKTSKDSILEGEIYFYQNIPSDVAGYFPKFIRTEKNGDFSSLVMSRVNGTPLTNLCISHCLSNRHLLMLLEALKDIHNSKAAAELKQPEINVYVNYAQKLKKRFKKHRMLYTEISSEKESKMHFETIVSSLERFEKEKLALESNCIHGDPVFSNVLDLDGSIILLDMRGKIGDDLTLRGDAHYDLAKVLQCLYGYDIVLQGGSVTEDDREYLANLRECFFKYVLKHYKTTKSTIQWITASHYFSLIPLHSERRKQAQYMRLCKDVLTEIETACKK